MSNTTSCKENDESQHPYIQPQSAYEQKKKGALNKFTCVCIHLNMCVHWTNTYTSSCDHTAAFVCVDALGPECVCVCVLLHCCDRPDLEKRWDRELKQSELRLSPRWQEGIQAPVLSFTEPGGRSYAPPPPHHTNWNGGVEHCCSRRREDKHRAKVHRSLQ